jgi:carbohydrate kinase (thermoresistant glucokinase family)
MEPVRRETGEPLVLVVMGVAGCGKSTVGRLLAERLGWSFLEGDDLHPASNVAKLREGRPLTDEDRWPWLTRVADWVDDRLDAGESAVVTCSALKRSYRERLAHRPHVVFVYLAAGRATLERRLAERRGHFMTADLLDSQLETLEEPEPGEPAIRVTAEAGAEPVVEEVLARLADLPEFTHHG